MTMIITQIIPHKTDCNRHAVLLSEAFKIKNAFKFIQNIVYVGE